MYTITTRDGLKFLHSTTAENVSIMQGSGLPVNAVKGDVFYLNTGSVGLYYYDGSSWDAASLGGGSNPTTLAAVAYSGAFADLINRPTTLSGYGISDGLSTSLIGQAKI